MPYIHFTEEQRQRANSVDLEEFLLQSGERLLPSGREKRMASDHSVTICGSEWYDHAAQRGGGPVAFLQHFHSLSYPEAVQQLLEGCCGTSNRVSTRKDKKKKTFVLPPAAVSMRRIFAYLIQIRKISREVLISFVQRKLIYEDMPYHNVVFVGYDEQGIPRHAHKRSAVSGISTFRQTVEGSDYRWAFHWVGKDSHLFMFESPIDLLSYITLHPTNWREHSYVASCGTTWLAAAGMLQHDQRLNVLHLCLDNDSTGHFACRRLEALALQEGLAVHREIPHRKDWNEDLQRAAEEKTGIK